MGEAIPPGVRRRSDRQAWPRTVDFLVMDHPSVGEATRFLLPLDEHLPPDFLTEQALSSVGPSYESYSWDGHHWALAIDAAAPVSCHRPDLLLKMRATVPGTWAEMLELARHGVVACAHAGGCAHGLLYALHRQR